jgi:hypothetical protein
MAKVAPSVPVPKNLASFHTARGIQASANPGRFSVTVTAQQLPIPSKRCMQAEKTTEQ